MVAVLALLFVSISARFVEAGTYVSNETNQRVRVAYVWAYDGDSNNDANAYFSKFTYLKPGESFQMGASFMKTQAIWLVYHFEDRPGSNIWKRAIPSNLSHKFSYGSAYRTTCHFDPNTSYRLRNNEHVIKKMRNSNDFSSLKSFFSNGKTWRCVRISPYAAHNRAPGATIRIQNSGNLKLKTW